MKKIVFSILFLILLVSCTQKEHIVEQAAPNQTKYAWEKTLVFLERNLKSKY